MQPNAEEGWHVLKGIDNADVATQYWSSIYAGVLTMVGDDINPQTNHERCFATIAILIGTGIFATLFGQGKLYWCRRCPRCITFLVALLIQNLNKAANEYRQKLELADENMRQMNLPEDFRRRVRRYFDYCWSLNKCLPRDLFLELLSPALASEVQLHFHLSILTAKLFNGTTADFLIGIVGSVQSRIYLYVEQACLSIET